MMVEPLVPNEEHTVGVIVENVTGRPDDADAEIVTGGVSPPANLWLDGDAKVIVCSVGVGGGGTVVVVVVVVVVVGSGAMAGCSTAAAGGWMVFAGGWAAVGAWNA